MTFPKSLSKFYWQTIKNYPLFFISVFILSFIVVVMEYVWSPFINKLAVSLFEKAVQYKFSDILKTLVFIGIFFLSEFIIKFILSIIEGKRKEVIKGDVGIMLYNRVYDNDARFFTNRTSGQIYNKIDEIQKNFYPLTLEFWTGTAGIIVGFLVISISLFNTNSLLAISIISFGIIRTAWQLYLQKTINKLGKKRLDLSSETTGIKLDTLVNAITAKMFARHDFESDYTIKKQKEGIDLRQKYVFLQRIRWAPMEFGWLLIRFAQIAFCWYLIHSGKITISEAVFSLSAFLSINAMFTRFNTILDYFFENRSRAEHAFEDIIQPVTVLDTKNAKDLNIKNANINFENVSFDYGEEQIIKNFNLDIKSGEKIGVVGLSGSGKTTLIKLILRLYDVKNGSIKVDGKDIRHVTQKSLRESIALVPQDSDLFNRTLMDNIKYGNPDKTDDDVIEAAKKANIHKFIDSLPSKYNTWVGGRGLKISGGQRQRIAIARAILKDSPILILDEATSALDSESEIKIHSALREIMKNKTTIAIAHRLSTLRNMDRIIVMDKGEISQIGTHNQLIRKNGLYRKFWELQTDGFIRV